MGACKICGKPSGYFPLCKECNELKSEGKIVKCEECGEWHYIDEPCECEDVVPSEKVVPEDGKCIVCEEESPYGPFCRDCYYEMVDFKDSFDKNDKAFELKDYYFNLKSNIYRMKTFDYVQNNCKKLMAIACLLKDLHDDTSLTERVVNDIKEIISSKKPKVEEVNVSEYSKTQDSRKEELMRTLDGHYVKSNPEAIIDDILYEQRIVHCYEKRVPINVDEKTIMCDWFIPVTDMRHGIYIEYWGQTNKEYLENKERKRKQYKEHDIPLIEIEKDDYNDKQGLTDRIVGEINKLAEKYYRIKDFIK